MSKSATVSDPTGREQARLMRLATYAAVGTAGLLIAVKTGAWAATQSVSVLSTLVDSMLDAVASLINLLAVSHALQPADAEHRFGHGKAEPLAGLGQAAFIAGSGMFLVFQVAERLIEPRPVGNGAVGIAVMVFSILATVTLVTFQRYVVRRTRSVAISADSLHYVSDVLVNGSVIAAIVLSANLGWTLADPLFGAGIAAYIVYSAWMIAGQSVNILMDRELPDEDRERIRGIVMGHPEVRAMRELKTRTSGPRQFIQLCVVFDDEISLRRAHDIAHQVENKIRAAFHDAEVIIHQEPGEAAGRTAGRT
ncbi:MAG: cation diffusion facilitator family transporter [Alphaproteobacteria bacterium]